MMSRIAVSVALAACLFAGACEEKITVENYDQITNGMTIAQVERLLGTGKDDTSHQGTSIGASGIQSASRSNDKVYVWEDKSGAKITVVFQDGKVVQKSTQNLEWWRGTCGFWIGDFGFWIDDPGTRDPEPETRNPRPGPQSPHHLITPPLLLPPTLRPTPHRLPPGAPGPQGPLAPPLGRGLYSRPPRPKPTGPAADRETQQACGSVG